MNFADRDTQGWTRNDIEVMAAEYLHDPTLAPQCAEELDHIMGVPHDNDGSGFLPTGDTRDRHYIRVWEAITTQNDERLAAMCYDQDYYTLLTVICGLKSAVRYAERNPVDWSKFNGSWCSIAK